MKKTPVITLLTDFGLQDEYVGVMKGVILSINSKVQLVDITHNLTRHDIMRAALVIKSAFKCFPRGTIHVIVVDPGVGGKRKIVCLKKSGHFFLAPDNGVLTFLVHDGEAEEICAVTNDAYFLEPVSNTFHGRDIFAPVAAHLSKGVDMLRLGERLALADITILDVPAPIFSADNELIGEIISIDHFGNLITNIHQATLDRFQAGRQFGDMVIMLGGQRITGVARSYDSVKSGSPVALWGSRNFLEISVNQANAREYFKASVGDAVRIESLTKKV